MASSDDEVEDKTPAPDDFRRFTDVGINFENLRVPLYGCQEKLRELFVEKTYKSGATICDFDTDPGLFIIRAGLVTVFHRSEGGNDSLLTETCSSGDAIGGGKLKDPERFKQSVRAVAVGAVLGIFLRASRYAAAKGLAPGLADAVRDLETLRSNRNDALTALRRCGALSHASTSLLVRLLAKVRLDRPSQNQVVVTEGEKPTGFYIVLEGELVATSFEPPLSVGALEGSATRTANSGKNVRDHLFPGDCFGIYSTLSGLREPVTMTVGERSKSRSGVEGALLLHVPLSAYVHVLLTSPAFRRQVRRGPLGTGSGPESWMHGEIVCLHSDDPSVRPALPAMTELLAQTLAEEHHDRVLVARVGSKNVPAPAQVPSPEVGKVSRVRLARVTDSGIQPNLETQLEALGREHRFELMFIILEDGDEETLMNMLFFLRAAWFFAPDERKMAVTVVEVTHEFTHATYLKPPYWQRNVYTRLLSTPAKRPKEADPQGTVRVRLDPKQFARLGVQPSRHAIEPGERAAFGRWARQISERLIGLALSGGGAFGFAHVPLIRRLADSKIPIDMVSGASFGTIVGAFYCSLGMNGLDVLLDTFKFYTAINAFILGRTVKRACKGANLLDLEVPLFPVATEIGTKSQAVIRTGGVDEGVLASGAFAPVFNAVSRGKDRYVDGAILHNVPVNVLFEEGADLVIASNCVPSPETPPPKDRPWWVPGFVYFVPDKINLLRYGLNSAIMVFAGLGNSDAVLADVLFQAKPGIANFWSMGKGKKIVEDVEKRSRAQLNRAVKEAAVSWSLLRDAPQARAQTQTPQVDDAASPA